MYFFPARFKLGVNGTVFKLDTDVGLTYPTGWIRLMVRNYQLTKLKLSPNIFLI